jgi:hypothetical protein
MSDGKIGNSGNSGLVVQYDQSKLPTTANKSFNQVLGDGVSAGANLVAQAGAMAAPFMPAAGAAIVTAAANQLQNVGGALRSSSGAQTAGLVGGNAQSLSAAQSTTTGTGSTVDQLAAGGDKQAIMMKAGQQMQEMNQSFNMQYLQLQQSMQDESRRFTCISNVMKTKHDTAKNSISNVR